VQFFDMITVLTITTILVILVLYVLVVCKKGWLKKELKADKVYYRCPNQKCRRVFKEPVWLTDLSQSRPEGYQACPHCGVNIQITSSLSSRQSNIEPDRQPKPHSLQSEPRKPEAQYIEKEIIRRRTETMREPSKPSIQTSLPRNEERTTSWQTPKPVVQDLQISSDLKSHGALEKQVEKRLSESPPTCIHFFGYARSVSKTSPFPDECLECPSLVKCLTYHERVENRSIC
jgi:hypothetical protein